jgi:nucleoside-diphosphate-sugar epimerase
MNVLLTGGYGCIGCWIAKNLLERGDRVWIYDLKQDLRRMHLVLDAATAAQITFVPGDVTDLDPLRTALEKNHISHVIHLAGLQVPVCRANPLLGAKVNVLGTLAVFEAVRALAGQVSGLVYASSAAVFGPPSEYNAGALDDAVKLTPSTHYGVFKCCNEGNARVYHQDFGLSSVGLRPWTVYGVGRDFGMTSEPTKAIKALALGRSWAISYGGFQDFQYVDDVARIFIRCVEKPHQGAPAYNLRGDIVDLQTFHQTLCRVIPEAKGRVTFGERQISIAYDLDDSALQRDFGPLAKTALEDGIRQTYERFLKIKSLGHLDGYDLDG